jgi:hypothetical protein
MLFIKTKPDEQAETHVPDEIIGFEPIGLQEVQVVDVPEQV